MMKNFMFPAGRNNPLGLDQVRNSRTMLSFHFVIACMSAMHSTMNVVDPCTTNQTEWSKNMRNLLSSALALRDVLPHALRNRAYSGRRRIRVMITTSPDKPQSQDYHSSRNSDHPPGGCPCQARFKIFSSTERAEDRRRVDWTVKQTAVGRV